MARIEVPMPQMGESIAEGTVSKWLKQVGDSVERDEPILEISTDKVDAEIPSPESGTLVEVRIQEGETVEVGTVVAYIDTEAGAAITPTSEETGDTEGSRPDSGPAGGVAAARLDADAAVDAFAAPFSMKSRMSRFVTRPAWPLPGTSAIEIPCSAAIFLTTGVDRVCIRSSAVAGTLPWDAV